MEIRTDDPFRQTHSQYVVAVHLAESLFGEMFPLAFSKRFGLNRRAVIRALAVQSVGQIVTFGSKAGPVLICVVIGTTPGSAKTLDVGRSFHKMRRVSDAQTAVISDNFHFDSVGGTTTLTDYDVLISLLRRIDFPGVLYGPLDMSQYSTMLTDSARLEDRATSTHTIVRHDGNISPSIPPTLLRGLRPKKT